MPKQAEWSTASDAVVWEQVCQGDPQAFEIAVRRHQSAVCAVAYSICGDREASEDVAQEAFWISWNQRNNLEQRDRLRPWLCGIARNLARQSHRKRTDRPSEISLDSATWDHAPDDEVLSAEQDALVWQSLETIPETYREPLILFYREQQSVAEVAAALELSTDAVKQRLSRGRALLREQVQDIVEQTLRRTRPGVALTVAIMAGLSGGKTAWGASATAAGVVIAKTTTTGALGAIAGPVIGTVGGLAGAWFGTWLPAQMAATNRERELMLKQGRSMLLVSVLFSIGILLCSLLPLGFRMTPAVITAMAVGYIVITGGFVAWIFIAAIRMNRQLKLIRAETPVGTDVNDTRVRRSVQSWCQQWRGRVWQSEWKLFGLPLVHFNVSDPQTPQTLPHQGQDYRPRLAWGWIAIGDEARGVILAIGNRAYGGIALGGIAVGVIAIGGMAAGGMTVGGLSIGIFATGGGAIGGLALGGLAVGWQAAGGLAAAWDIAVGGLGLAHHAAFGGAAIARDFAVGGFAQAAHANDEAAKAVLLTHPLKVGMDWYAAHTGLMTVVILVIALLPSVVCWPFFYRRATTKEMQAASVLAPGQ